MIAILFTNVNYVFGWICTYYLVQKYKTCFHESGYTCCILNMYVTCTCCMCYDGKIYLNMCINVKYVNFPKIRNYVCQVYACNDVMSRPGK